jgi:hypothetical protein
MTDATARSCCELGSNCGGMAGGGARATRPVPIIEDGAQVLTLKPSVVTEIKSHAFSK